MKLHWARISAVLVLLVAMLPVAPAAHAQLASCTVNLSPTSVAPGADTDFSFGIYDSDANPINWIQITRPAGSYVTLESGGASGWQADMTADTVTFSNGNLQPNGSQGFDVQALASSSPGGPVNWTVQASDAPDGSNPITCDGDTSLTIAVQPSIINVSNVRLASVSATNVTILWDTDVASTSQVAYGADSSYGSHSPLNSSLVTSHSVTLTGLSPNTGYHYAVTSSTPADGGTTTSNDNTFLTAVQPPPVVIQVPGITTPNVPGATIKPTPTETVPPTVSITSDLSRPFKQVPTISGTASDNDAVARVEYSIDGGKDWLPVDKVTPNTVTTTTGKGKAAKTTTAATNASVTFSFTPILVEDGNYAIEARATDSSGNQARTAPVTLVIDRLPPRFGAALLAFGSQVSVPDAGGRWQAAVDVDETITLNAVGGPVTASIVAGKQSFTLRHDTSTGLWAGVLSFHQAGTYHLAVAAVDGAGNQTNRPLTDVTVLPAPQVVARDGGRGVAGAKVTLYQRQQSGQWRPWDGAAYGQANPQRADRQGAYQLLAPAGTYYLRAEAAGYETVASEQFTLSQATPLVSTLKLPPRPEINLGFWRIPLPLIALVPAGLRTGLAASASRSSLIGHSLPAFSLATTGGSIVTTASLLAKPTLITVLATWAPPTAEQIPSLVKLQANHDINVLPVTIGERPGQVGVFLDRAGYNLNVALDPDATLNATLGVPSVPTHYILDRRGTVKAVLTGVFTADQLQKALQDNQ
ncbi:MAG TPA: Ig-like domain-containing protein [Candidatus Saccharimonadia bacterium]|nr:Ig-like domain-containing protein [Candidatus Saccharimonadia bacterium]